MKRFLFATGFFLIVGCFVSVCNADEKNADMPRVLLETNHGSIVLELNSKAAPKTVENFLTYVRDGFYNKTIFHRVIKGFMIQGGGYTKEMYKKIERNFIINEADNGLKNKRGTIAMARTNKPHTASSQFFINLVDSDFLDHKEKTGRGWGYCVFGHVVEGMKVVDIIADQRTTIKTGLKDVPFVPVIIENTSIIIKETNTKKIKKIS